MDKFIYCVGKISKNNKEMILNESKQLPAKRINFVSVKLVRDKSFLYKNRTVSEPKEAYELVREILENEDREKLIACFLNTKNQPVAINVISVGSLNSSIIHPREIFKVAILSNSASFILFHNHPSGNPEPSSEDIMATSRIKECGKLMGIEMLDHIIIGDETYCSMVEKGLV